MLPMQLQLIKVLLKSCIFQSLFISRQYLHISSVVLTWENGVIGIGKKFRIICYKFCCQQQIRDIKQLLITNKNANIILGTERGKMRKLYKCSRGKNTGCFSSKMQIVLHILFMYSKTRWTSLWSYKFCGLKGQTL